MEPLDTDLEYIRSGPRPAKPGSRYSAMLMIPILGLLLVLIFIGAAIFQWDLSTLVDSLVGLLLVLFVVTIGLFFWAGASRSRQA
jgi:fumarate reductase subunit D